MEDIERTSFFHPDDLGSLLQQVSHDPRMHVRARAAELTGSIWRGVPLDAAQQALARLCRDPSARVRAAAGRGLALVIERATPVERVELIGAWSTSADWHQRAAIARALCAHTPMFVTDLAIEQLASDPVAEVRAAALEAAAAHFEQAPRVYAAIAQARSDDQDEAVRYAARRLLMRR